MAKIIVNAWSTSKGIEWFRRMVKPGEVTEVIINKKLEGGGGPVPVKFKLKNGDTIELIETFSTGYGGEGPSGLYEILRECGFSAEKAEIAFTCVDKGEHILKR